MAVLQDGIAYAKETRPGAFFAIIFLQADVELDARRGGGALADLWGVYEGLMAGRVLELKHEVVQHEDDRRQVLIGYGANAGSRAGGGVPVPAGFEGNRFRAPQGRGGPLL